MNIGECGLHGVTEFIIEQNIEVCASCWRSYPREAFRYRAQKFGVATFPARCDNHGETSHHVGNGKCAACFDRYGRKRAVSPRNEGLRGVARQAGLLEFTATCPDHGETSHHVGNGKCATCFDRYGRKRVGKQDDGPRALARCAGLDNFAARCDYHGLTDHHVGNGKCATCFDKWGRKRSMPAAPSPRAVARRAGASSYMASCDRHGMTPHSVVHGKCLTCFTATGAKRKFMRVPVE